MDVLTSLSFFFFFNDTATTEIYTLSLHDALPILEAVLRARIDMRFKRSLVCFESSLIRGPHLKANKTDRKSTRLNSSHTVISYAVFCLKKKKNKRSTLQKHQ